MIEKMKIVDIVNLYVCLEFLFDQDFKDELGSIVEAFNKMFSWLEIFVEMQCNFIIYVFYQFNIFLMIIFGEIEFVWQYYKFLFFIVVELLDNIFEEFECFNWLMLCFLYLVEVGMEGINDEG